MTIIHFRKRIMNVKVLRRFPKDGLAVIREVCDPTKPKDSHDEAQVHEENGHPVLSWWNLQGQKMCK